MNFVLSAAQISRSLVRVKIDREKEVTHDRQSPELPA